MLENTRNLPSSGGTIASILGVFEQAWSGGLKVMNKLEDPLLLTPPGAFGKTSGPGGLGYDLTAKCKT